MITEFFRSHRFQDPENLVWPWSDLRHGGQALLTETHGVYCGNRPTQISTDTSKNSWVLGSLWIAFASRQWLKMGREFRLEFETGQHP